MPANRAVAVEGLHSALSGAWSDTINGLDQGVYKTEGVRNARRSAFWLRNLGKRLCKLAGDASQFSMRPEPGSGGSDENEFLFDLIIHASPDGLLYTGKRLWAVESEFERGNHAVRRDLAKLFWADVENRLFIYGAANPNFRDKLEVLKGIKNWERPSRGSLFICAVPHPADWTSGMAWEFRVEPIFQPEPSAL